MAEEYSKEFFWETYEKLPEDIKEAIFSEKNNEAVNTICKNFNLNEDQTSSTAKYIGRVLMGILPLEELPLTLELELNINEETASKLFKELNIAIFKHLRISLSKAGHDLSVIGTEPVIVEEKKEPLVEKIKKSGIIKKQDPNYKDSYREVF